jgi:hypothetical protein
LLLTPINASAPPNAYHPSISFHALPPFLSLDSQYTYNSQSLIKQRKSPKPVTAPWYIAESAPNTNNMNAYPDAASPVEN